MFKWEVQIRDVSDEELWVRVQRLTDDEDYVDEISFIGDDAFVPVETADYNFYSAVVHAIPKLRRHQNG